MMRLGRLSLIGQAEQAGIGSSLMFTAAIRRGAKCALYLPRLHLSIRTPKPEKNHRSRCFENLKS